MLNTVKERPNGQKVEENPFFLRSKFAPQRAQRGEIFIDITEITPEMASHWLKHNNKGNRRVRRANVEFLKIQILEGKYEFNGEPISFDSDFFLRNGQHTCMAIAETGIGVTKAIAYNISKSAAETMDTGAKRNGADILSFHYDCKYVTQVASAASFVISFNRGRYGIAAKSGGEKHKSVDNKDILGFVKENEEFIAFVDESYRLYSNGDKLLSPKLFNGLYWILSKKNKEKADLFFTQLSTSIGIEGNGAVLILRKKLTEIHTNSNVRKTYISSTDKIYLVIRAWNLFIEGKTLKRLVPPKKMPKILS